MRILLIPLCLLAACAQVTHRPLVHDEKATGIRYYQTSLYLLVHSDGKGGVVARFHELPDQTKKMVAEPTSIMATLDLTMNFTNGALTSADEMSDSSAIPAALIKAAQAIATKLVDVAAFRADADTRTATIPAPYLYKVRVTGDRLDFIGGQGTESVSFTLAEEG